MPSLKQTSFAGGIISDRLIGHTDQAKYSIGLKKSRNFWITRYATAENRPGSRYIDVDRNPTHANRLVKFVFNNSVSYLLVFSDGYIVPYRNGSRISTVGAPAYAGGTAYVIGNVVTSAGATYVCIQAGTGHTPAGSPTYWLALAGNNLVLPSVFTQAYLADFQTVQQNDVMTLVEQAVYPQVLTRFSDTQWTTAQFSVTTGIAPPGSVAVTIGVSGSPTPAKPVGLTATGGDGSLYNDRYVVSAWNASGESVQSATAAATNGTATGANPVALAWTAVGGAIGYGIYKDQSTGPLPSNIFGLIGVSNSNAFSDNGIVSATKIKLSRGAAAGSTVFDYVVTAVDATTGAESLASATATGTGGTPTTDNPNIISWALVANASAYRVYRIVGGVPGYIGNTNNPAITFPDNNITPDTAIQPPTVLSLFSTSSDYPAAVGYYQQRLAFANTINNPTGINMSRVGQFANFGVSTPISDDDAIAITVAGQRNDSVQHLVDLGKLIIHTAGSEYVANGNQSGAVTPLSIGLVRQGSAGASSIPPLVLGNTDIFVQARGGYIRDLRYEIQSTSFAGKDLTIFAPDLLANRTIVSLDWQQTPHAIIWAALDDGALLGLTYIREQDIWSWHEHDLSGTVEQVCVVPEATEDVVYLTVKRVINGTATRYIERLTDRAFETIDDACFVDCALSYDGRNTGGTTMVATTAAGWTSQDSLTLTASAPEFTAGDVRNAIVFQKLADGTTYTSAGVRIPAGTVLDQVTFLIIAYTSATVVTVQADKTVPTWAQVALTTWGRAVHTFSGLDHLEAATVGGLGDGNVIPQTTVSAGAITTAINYLRLTVGLPITADLQTLPLENAQGETIANKRVLVHELTANFYQTRGGKYGQDFDHLHEWDQRRDEAWSDPVALFTGPVRIPVQGSWQTTGGIAIRQSDPLPIGLSAVAVTAFTGN